VQHKSAHVVATLYTRQVVFHQMQKSSVVYLPLRQIPHRFLNQTRMALFDRANEPFSIAAETNRVDIQRITVVCTEDKQKCFSRCNDVLKFQRGDVHNCIPDAMA